MLIDEDDIYQILKDLDLPAEDIFVVSIPLFGPPNGAEQSEYDGDPSAAETEAEYWRSPRTV